MQGSVFEAMLDYFLNYEAHFKQYAELVEYIEGYADKYYRKWDNSQKAKYLQRLFWGLLLDFRHPLNGKKMSLSEWFSFPLHHWRTAGGHENKYSCVLLSLIPLPEEDHNRITTQIENDDNAPEIGREWERRIGKIIECVLDDRKIPVSWRENMENEDLKDFKQKTKIVREIMKIFILHDNDFLYVRK